MEAQSIIFLLLAVFLTACYAQSNCHARYRSSCYYFSPHGDDKDQAEKECQKIKGNLVTIDTQGEQKFLHDQVMRRNNADYWIGVEAVRNRYMEQTDWKWNRNGAYLRRYVANWADRQPNDFNTRENCVIYSKDLDYQWDDVPCYEKHLYICEMQA